ncbi:hypothetical protein JVU11DRAFT_8101 [Chiua virens]|nr:hypothetical protein JVU11DRAFT_8101 [Chiua virens]
MAFLTELATNATAHGVSIVIYSGNDNSLVPHFGSQVCSTAHMHSCHPSAMLWTLQITGMADFLWLIILRLGESKVSRAKPSHGTTTPTSLLVSSIRNVVERHLLGYTNPISVLTLVREFIFGNNQTGLVSNTSSGTVSVVGGKASSLAGEIMTGQAAIYHGNGVTPSDYVFPLATV